MTHRCNSRQYVEAGLILHEHLPRSAANISAASLSAFLSAIAAKLHWPLWVHCPQQTHTTTATANIAQRHHVSTTHGEEMGGWEKALFKLIEVAALTHFLFRHFCCLWNDHPWCSSSSSELRLALGGFFVFFFKTFLADTVICPFLSESRRAEHETPAGRQSLQRWISGTHVV